jgi:hypothetical protein
MCTRVPLLSLLTQEILARNRGTSAPLLTAAPADSAVSSDEDGGVSAGGSIVRYGNAVSVVRPRHGPGHKEDEDDYVEGGPNNSPWGRRALGDAWYEERCVRCSVCRRAVNASERSKRGQRCVGCLRWFHDTCAPKGSLPADKAQREGDPMLSQ